MGRSPCCAKEGLNRGAWAANEDKILRDYITEHGEGRWRNLPQKAGLKRCGKSCRLRWLNYLRPDIKRGNISPDEEELIIRLHKLLGNRWSLIAGRLPGRTDNEIKNYWNTNLRKRVKDQQRSSALSFSTDRKQENMKKAAENLLSPNVSKSPLKMESHVIRTKATKCSKFFISPQSQKTTQFLGSNTEAGASSFSMLDRDSSLDNKPIESNTYHRASSLLAENIHPSDLMIEFNMGEFRLPDLLNTDFSDFCGFASKSSSNDNSNESPSSEQPLVFFDEMMQDIWTDSNSASNLNSLASFFGSGGDWLGC